MNSTNIIDASCFFHITKSVESECLFIHAASAFLMLAYINVYKVLILLVSYFF